MTSRDQLNAHLNDHLPYELLMLRYCFQKMTAAPYPLDWNAYFESFSVHARNLFDFLNNEGTGNNLKAKEFSTDFKASKDKIVGEILNQKMHRDIFHFGKSRPSEDERKIQYEQVKKVRDWIEDNMRRFLDELGELSVSWNAGRADPAEIRRVHNAAVAEHTLTITPFDLGACTGGGVTLTSQNSTTSQLTDLIRFNFGPTGPRAPSKDD